MRSIENARSRWESTLKESSSLDAFKRLVRSTGDDNPCHAGLRSVCWKIFLLFRDINQSSWIRPLADSRAAYSSLREHFLKFIERPDELGSTADPLNDDQSSPWNTLRQDEEIRAEIFQDVERCMPEEPYFRQAETQRLMLDILFIWCKLNQDVGYRQGMHELLAPILWAIEGDAIDSSLVQDPSEGEQLMANMLNSKYIEHDAFTIFSLLMQHAKSFYELGEPEGKSNPPSLSSGIVPAKSSPIVERSSNIHLVYLTQVDPELSKHLTEIEILPQIFLIRWIRLIFGREFPFEELLGLWDILFAEDPALDLVDMICVAMLLRIRWELIEADYSTALTLLLKYPSPSPLHGPESFVTDATFLRDNCTISGGSEIIEKYHGKRPLSPMNPQFGSPTNRIGIRSDAHGSPRTKARASLPSPARFLQQQGGIEALLQVAAKGVYERGKGVYERGEKLGINQKVRDAVVEVRKNVQNLQTPRPPSSSRGSADVIRWSLDEGRPVLSPQRNLPPRKSQKLMEHRNKVLGKMLDVATDELRIVSSKAPESMEAKQYVEAIDVALAKIQFIQVYLDDSSIPLPDDDEPEIFSSSQNTPAKLDEPADIIGSIDSAGPASGEQTPITRLEIKADSPAPVSPAAPEKAPEKNSSQPLEMAPLGADLPVTERPKAPVPTRSSLAQSSFAFMLEPDQTASSPPKPSSPFSATSKKTSAPARERTAFLFGDASDDDDSLMGKKKDIKVSADDGFNLGTMKGAKSS